MSEKQLNIGKIPTKKLRIDGKVCVTTKIIYQQKREPKYAYFGLIFTGYKYGLKSDDIKSELEE